MQVPVAVQGRGAAEDARPAAAVLATLWAVSEGFGAATARRTCESGALWVWRRAVPKLMNPWPAGEPATRGEASQGGPRASDVSAHQVWDAVVRTADRGSNAWRGRSGWTAEVRGAEPLVATARRRLRPISLLRLTLDTRMRRMQAFPALLRRQNTQTESDSESYAA